MEHFEKVKDKILEAKTIAIFGHMNPDGDSIGSILALGLGMERLGKVVYMISQDGVPKRFVDLPGADRIVCDAQKKVDLAIAVDCGSSDMLGKSYDIFRKAKFSLELDHHEFRTPFADLGIVDTEASSVGEIIYMLLIKLGVGMTKEIAENIFTAIIIETNSFSLPNIRSMTFNICTKLMETGLNFYKLIDMIFWSRSKESIILSGICLSRCKFAKDSQIVWSVIRKKDFIKFGGKDEDVDAVADEMRAIKGVRISALFREKENNLLRVSMRSKGGINIAALAEYYGGGGHIDVAGCHIADSPDSIKKFLTRAEKLLK